MLNWYAILGSAVLAMIVGAIWYGPLFGKKWLQVTGASERDLAERAAMQKRAMPLYAIQLLLVLWQVWVLAPGLAGRGSSFGMMSAGLIWAAFIMPTVAAGAMWNNDSAKISWARFGIQAGYQLVVFVLFGFILGGW